MKIYRRRPSALSPCCHASRIRVRALWLACASLFLVAADVMAQTGRVEVRVTGSAGPVAEARIELLRRKGLMTFVEMGAPKWLHTKQVVGKVRDAWHTAQPMNAWLDAHVGPSTLEPDGFF